MTMIATAPRSLISPRLGMELPQRVDRVLVDKLTAAYLLLDSDLASLQTSNAFGAPQTFSSTVNVDARLTARAGVEVTGNLILAQQAYQILLGGAGAFVKAYASDESYVQINQLNVTPGGLSAASCTVNGNASITGQATAGTLFATGRLITNNWDIAWSNNINGNAISSGMFQCQGRLLTNAWDAGWANNCAGDLITSGNVTSRSGHRCWDGADFSPAVGVVGAALVQRDGNGYIYCQHVNMTADLQGGRPAWVAGQNGSDNFLRWYSF